MEDQTREPFATGPGEGDRGWLALSDDDLLFRIESLPADHSQDGVLVAVAKSNRHFFVRQEAAKKIDDKTLLKEHLHDRHIGQILVRQMTRAADVAYLERLRDESRYIEVRKAAEAQLHIVAEPKKK